MWLPDDKVRALIRIWRLTDAPSDYKLGLDAAADELEAFIDDTQQPKPMPSLGSARCMAYGGEPDIEVTG